MMTTEIALFSQRRCELIDITAEVEAQVRASGIANGLVQVFTLHTTAALTINENADPDVQIDLLRRLEALAPPDPADRHSEGNSAAHLKSSLLGAGQTLILAGGRLQLGTWQSLYFCEFDGPRRRRVLVKILAG